MMNVYITGATGFVGKNLSVFLSEKNVEVSGVSLRDSNWKYQFQEAAHALVHLAGKAHDTANTSSSDDYFSINRDLTIELFDVFLKSEIQDFFFFSSVKAAADTVETVLVEDVVPHPVTPYGKSKLEAEEYLLQQTLPAGKRLFIIRPCMIHGPGNKGNLNLLYKVVEKGVPWPLAAFDNKRSFLSVDNLNFLIFEMMKNEHLQSGIYQFSDDTAISTNKLVELIAKSTSKNPKLWNIPRNLLRFVARIGDVLKLPLNSERLKKLTENYVVSNQKIKSALGIEQLSVSTEEGLLKTLNSFKK